MKEITCDKCGKSKTSDAFSDTVVLYTGVKSNRKNAQGKSVYENFRIHNFNVCKRCQRIGAFLGKLELLIGVVIAVVAVINGVRFFGDGPVAVAVTLIVIGLLAWAIVTILSLMTLNKAINPAMRTKAINQHKSEKNSIRVFHNEKEYQREVTAASTTQQPIQSSPSKKAVYKPQRTQKLQNVQSSAQRLKKLQVAESVLKRLPIKTEASLPKGQDTTNIKALANQFVDRDWRQVEGGINWQETRTEEMVYVVQVVETFTIFRIGTGKWRTVSRKSESVVGDRRSPSELL